MFLHISGSPPSLPLDCSCKIFPSGKSGSFSLYTTQAVLGHRSVFLLLLVNSSITPTILSINDIPLAERTLSSVSRVYSLASVRSLLARDYLLGSTY